MNWPNVVKNLQLKPHKILKVMNKYPATTCSPFIAIFMSSLISICAIGGNSISRPTLKDTYKNDFKIGVAINQKQFTEEDTNGAAIIKTQFNSISPENVLKWESIQPRPGADGYNFEPGDRYVEFGEKNGMYIIGHTLVWHSQTPKWVFQGEGTNDCDRDTLLKRMHDHIQTVVGRYKGRIKCWDVVNEALQDNGELRKSPWLKIIGEDYIAKAFEYAHEADPDAVLRYNDYSLENEAKRKGAVALIKKLQAQGIPVTSVGLQDHVKMDWPTMEQEDATISDFAKLGVKVMITELDVDLLSRNRSADVAEMQRQAMSNIYTNRLPDSVQQALARRYADLFSVFLKHRNEISLVTFWGVTDGDSWLNRGRMNYPLLFDRTWQPKPAFDAVIGVVRQ
jgi:endo-1,4-beta-xylanase